jgi:hypothetical protein
VSHAVPNFRLTFNKRQSEKMVSGGINKEAEGRGKNILTLLWLGWEARR